jgi:hypothetical protein
MLLTALGYGLFESRQVAIAENRLINRESPIYGRLLLAFLGDFMKQYLSLRYGREPLQVPIPEDFQGERGDPDAPDLWITTQPGLFTLDEQQVIEAYLPTLPYSQVLVKGAIMIDSDDPLLELDHEGLSKVEAENGLQITEFAPGSGRRTLYERVLIIREQGFLGNGKLMLAEAS